MKKRLKKSGNKQEKNKHKFLYWSPRILAIILIIFFSLFALDLFSGGYTPSQVLIGLFIYLIPSFILIGITIFAWNNEKVGGVLFMILGLIIIVLFTNYQYLVYMIIDAGPFFLVGYLFLLSARKNKQK